MRFISKNATLGVLQCILNNICQEWDMLPDFNIKIIER